MILSGVPCRISSGRGASSSTGGSIVASSVEVDGVAFEVEREGLAEEGVSAGAGSGFGAGADIMY